MVMAYSKSKVAKRRKKEKERFFRGGLEGLLDRSDPLGLKVELNEL